MKKGDSCTVSHHYGHTDTERVFVIEDVGQNDRFNSGIAVKVKGFERLVDSGLINIVKVPMTTIQRIERLEETVAELTQAVSDLATAVRKRFENIQP